MRPPRLLPPPARAALPGSALSSGSHAAPRLHCALAMTQEADMSAAATDDYLVYWEAIQRRACAVCLDAHDDGTCGLPRGRTCALPAQLPTIVTAIVGVHSDHMDDYVAAIEAAVCARCPEQDAAGHCRLRGKGECGLYTYLPLVVDAIEEVKAERAEAAR
jgi:hypothetical protein